MPERSDAPAGPPAAGGGDLGAVRFLARLFRQTGLSAWVLPLCAGLGFAASVLEGLGIGLLIPLIGLMAPPDGAAAEAGFVRALTALVADLPGELRAGLVGAAIVALVMLRAAVVFANTAFNAWLETRIGHELRRRLLRRIVRGDYAAVSALGPDRLVETLSGEVWRVTELVTSALAVLTQAATVVAFSVLLALLSWKLSLTVIAVGGLAVLATTLLSGRARGLGERIAAEHVRLSEQTLEVAYGLRLVRVFGREALEEERFSARSDRVRRLTWAWACLSAAATPLLEVLFIPVFVSALVFGRLFGLDLPAIVAFLLLLYRVQGPARAIGSQRVRIAGFLAAGRPVLRLLALPDPAPAAPAPPVAAAGFLAFEGVSFAYGPDRSALRAVSFTIARGETVALVGRSGSGKSTLINLILGLHRPQAGAIRVEGDDLAGLDPAAWRAGLALAGQGTELVAGTVAENIAYGRPGAGAAEIEAAARAAAAHDFVAALPGGYAYSVGARGGRLSGGQQQRIGLARALLRRPDLLILDEATNALDGLTARDVRAALAALPEGMTVIVVAHHIDSLRSVDRVLVLDEGRLIEEGTPAALLAHPGAFARLYGLEPGGGT